MKKKILNLTTLFRDVEAQVVTCQKGNEDYKSVAEFFLEVITPYPVLRTEVISVQKKNDHSVKTGSLLG